LIVLYPPLFRINAVNPVFLTNKKQIAAAICFLV